MQTETQTAPIVNSFRNREISLAIEARIAEGYEVQTAIDSVLGFGTFDRAVTSALESITRN